MRNLSDDRRLLPAAGATLMSVVLACVYWVSRIGFANPVAPVAFAVGVSLFHFAVPNVAVRIMGTRGLKSVWMSEPVIAIACMAITMLAGVVAFYYNLSAAIGISIIGALAAMWIIVRWLPRNNLKSTVLFLVGAVIFTVWCAGVVWGSRYKMPLFWETLSYKANIHHDTFYYTSMTQMMETYGVPSTGLDGIPIIKYHFGSPWLFGKWAHLIGVDVLTFYSLGYPIIVMPLLFYGVLLLAQGAARSDWRAWAVFLAATVGFIPARALDAFAIWNSNAFISESYLIGMPVFLLVLASGVAFWDRNREARRFGTANSLYLLLFLPVMLGVLGFLKISLMLLLLAVAWYLIVRLWLWTRPVVIASVILSAIVVAITYRIVQLPNQNGGLSPLHFMRFDAAQGWQQFFPLFHLLWTWVYVAGRMWEERITHISQLGVAIRTRRIIDVEVLLVIAVLGFIPGELVSIHGGSAVYFSDVQRWVAIAFIMSRLPGWTAEWKARRTVPEIHTGVGGIRLSRVLGVFVLAPFVITLFVNLAQWPVRVLRTNQALRAELEAQGGESRSAYYPIVTELRNIATLPRETRKHMALFIPQANMQYWSMFTADGRCSWTPMIAPAVAGVALIDGMPAYGCNVTEQYNMPIYAARTARQTSADTTDVAVCAKARAKGFREVMVIDAPPVRPRRVNCYLGLHG
jgi:hypothetical protein